MRIGAVSSYFKISTDSLYYYINYGLLVPPRPKGQYNFDKKTLADLKLILDLKELDFSLQEIHKIISLYRISELKNGEDIAELTAIFTEKRESCLEKEKHMKKAAQILEEKITELASQNTVPKVVRGVPVKMLDLLCCPKCKGTLSMSNINMNPQYIFSGSLSCACGYCASIEDGILITPNKYTGLFDKPDLKRELYKDLPPTLISHFERSGNWMSYHLKKLPLKNKVVMESYVNAWFYMHNHLNCLEPSAQYIVVDKYPETLLMYKKIIEQQNYPLDILYLADCSTQFPLKNECVDLHLDFFAINEHNFYHHSFLIDRLIPYLKKDASLLGTYFYFENAPVSRRTLLTEYPESSAQNFDLNFFKNSMKQTPFSLVDHQAFGLITYTGRNLGFGFHHAGEKMGMLSYLGCRNAPHS